MAIVSNNTPGSVGLILDMEASELPVNAWSDAQNVRFASKAAVVMLADQEITTTSEQLEYAFPVQSLPGEGAAWILAGNTKAWALEETTLTEITPSGTPGIASAQLTWSGGSLGTLAFLNNGLQKPWVWMENDPLVDMVELPNWPATLLAQTLRSFKQYLVALNVTKGSTNYPTLVKWSHPADPGTVPSSWDEADPTKDAGEFPLSETPGACIDCVSMRDVNIIYKTDSVWGMQYIGGVFIFRFYKIFGNFGTPTKNCAVEYTSGKHFVYTGTDILIHDGNSHRSVATDKVRSVLRIISATQVQACYVVSHTALNEVWFCFRRATDDVLAADTALCWNHLDETWSLRLLPECRYIGVGVVEPQALAELNWGTSTKGWDTSGIIWGEYATIPAYLRLLGLGSSKLYWIDGLTSGLQPAYLERTHVGVPIKTGSPPDLSTNKFIRRVWPRFQGPIGLQLKVTFGTANSLGRDILWRQAKTFIIGTSEKLDLTLTGKMLAVRIETDPDSPVQGVWSYHGLDIDILPVGEN